jgi:hypothetical protein
MWLAMDWFSFWKIRAGSSWEMSEPNRTRSVRAPCAITGIPKAPPSAMPAPPASNPRRPKPGGVRISTIPEFSLVLHWLGGRVGRPEFLGPVARQACAGRGHRACQLGRARGVVIGDHAGRLSRQGVAAS